MMEDKNNLPELPKGWVWTTCNQLIKEIETGKRPTGGVDKYTNGIPSIGGEHLNSNGGFNFSNLKFVPEEFFNNMSKGVIRKGNVLIVKDGATTGKVSFVSENFPFEKAAVNEHVFILRFFENMMLSKYIFYFLFSGLGQKQIKTKGIIGGINKNFINYIKIPLPPLPEQHRIVAKIEELFTKLNAGIDTLKKIKTQLKRYRQSVLKSAMEGKLTEKWREAHKHELEPASVLLEKIKEERKKKLGKKYKELLPVDMENLSELPQGWVWTRLGEIITFEYGKGLREDKRDQKGNVPVYGSNGIVGYHSVPLIEKPCLIVGRKGAAGYVHLSKVPCWPIDTTYYIIPPDELKLIFFYYLLSTLNLNSLDKSTAIPGLNRNDAYTLNIPIPPLPEQHKIVEEIEKRFTVADEVEKRVEQSLKQAERMRQSILKKAFEGKLVSQDPTDEPANVLLERIKKEKEKLEADKKQKGNVEG